MHLRPLRTSWVLALVIGGIALLSCARRMGSAPVGPRIAASAPLRAARAQAGPGPVAPGPRMNHTKHLDKGLECADCHLKGEGDTKLTEPAIPTLAICAECHDEEDAQKPEEQRVRAVFFQPDGSPRWKVALKPYASEVRWGHAPHAKLACTDCHGDLDAPERRERTLFDMEGCMACHTQKSAPNRCETCHTDLRANVAPPSHKTDWRGGHGASAIAGQERCEICHSDSAWCDRCHQTTPPASHALGWQSAHGRAALSRSQRCEMCHTDPQACVACHLKTAPASHGTLWKERHGTLARTVRGRMEGRCDLCHLDPNFCEKCHAVEPPRNHTHLFRTRTHGVMAAIDRTSCQVCHDTDFCIRCHEDTPPRSHGPMWASGASLHCGQCHFPLRFEGSCRACHFEEPQHASAPDQPPSHIPGMNCRLCHTPAGNGAPPLRHIDNGTQCERCHR